MRWLLQILLLLFPAILFAFEYTPADVKTALDRHDVRRLETYAGDANNAIRLQAVQSLVLLTDPQVIPFLIVKMDDPDPEVVLAAVWGLPNFGAAAATQIVIARLQEAQRDPSLDVRKAAGVVLEDLKDPDQLLQMRRSLVMKDSEQHPDALKYYIARKDYSILSDAKQMLASPDPFLKQTGLLLVHGLDDRDSLDAIIRLLKDPSPTVRASAALVVGEWKEAESFSLLEPLLTDAEPVVRASAVAALGKHLTPDIIRALSILQTDKEAQVRGALVKALAQFPSPESVDALLAMALDDNPVVRGPAIEGLVAFRNADVTQTMNRFLKDAASRRRRRAAIAYLSDPSLLTPAERFMPLVHDKDGEVRLHAVEAILAAPGTAGKGQLVYLLNDPKKEIRLVIVRKTDVLLKDPKMNKRALAAALDKLSKDPDPEIQELAKKYRVLVNP